MLIWVISSEARIAADRLQIPYPLPCSFSDRHSQRSQILNFQKLILIGMGVF